MSPSWISSRTYLIWCKGRWLDLDLNWRKIHTLIWKCRNELDFWGSKCALLDLEMTLYFGRVSVGFFYLSFCHLLIWEVSIYRQLNSIQFGIFSQHLLRINYEFGLSFNKNFPYRSFLLTLPYGFLHFTLPRGLISFADRPYHQLEINLITNILSWSIRQMWMHHKILMSTKCLHFKIWLYAWF